MRIHFAMCSNWSNQLKKLVKWIEAGYHLGVPYKVIKKLKKKVGTDGLLCLGPTELAVMRVPGDMFPVKPNGVAEHHTVRPPPKEDEDWVPNPTYYHAFFNESEL